MHIAFVAACNTAAHVLGGRREAHAASLWSVRANNQTNAAMRGHTGDEFRVQPGGKMIAISGGVVSGVVDGANGTSTERTVFVSCGARRFGSERDSDQQEEFEAVVTQLKSALDRCPDIQIQEESARVSERQPQ